MELPAMKITDTITERREARLRSKTGAYPRSQPIASNLSDCMRETVLGIRHWKERPAFEPQTIARLERGSKIEDWIILELQQLGFTVRAERQPFEIKDRRGRVVCRGKVDGFISDALDGIRNREYPFEVKSMLPFVFDKIQTLDDFNRFHWTRKYPRQLQTYLYANNLEEGFFLLDDCMGHWRAIPVTLDYEATERILQQCEGAVEHLANETLPDYHADPSVCAKCWAYGRVCDPPMMHGEGVRALEDYELEAKLDRRADLKPNRDEYERIDKEVKGRFKGMTNIVIGNWLVTGTEGVQHRKAQEAKDIPVWRTKVERIAEEEQE